MKVVHSRLAAVVLPMGGEARWWLLSGLVCRASRLAQ